MTTKPKTKSIFLHREPVELTLEVIKINAQRLRRIGFDKTTPYYVQGLLEDVIRVIEILYLEDPVEIRSLREVIDDRMAHHAQWLSEGVLNYPLPPEYADILDDTMSIVLYFICPDREVMCELGTRKYIEAIADFNKRLEACV